MSKLRRIVAGMVVISTVALSVPSPAAAGMIGTEAAVAGANAARDRVGSFLDRADVRARLETYGVSAADVQLRVASLSDSEAAQLARDIDSLPAGGDAGIGAVVGALLVVFLVLLLTDLLGLTKVFPFTKPMR